MNAQDTQDANVRQRFSEDDLPVTEERADTVKGGSPEIDMPLKGIKILQN